MAKTQVGNERDRIRFRLEEARARLFEAIGGLTEEQMRRRPGPDRWSVAEVMAHLPVWERHMLGQADSLRQVEQDPIVLPTQAEQEEAAGRGRRLPVPAIVHDLVAARWSTLTFLECLKMRELARRGRHQEQGDLTLAQVLTIIAEYEEEQAGRILRLRTELGLPLPDAAMRSL